VQFLKQNLLSNHLINVMIVSDAVKQRFSV